MNDLLVSHHRHMIHASCILWAKHAILFLSLRWLKNWLYRYICCWWSMTTPNLHSVAGRFSGSFQTLIGLYQVILSRHSGHQSVNFRFFLNERYSEQQGDSSLAPRRSATAKSTIWMDSSTYLACRLNRRLMNVMRLVRWNSLSENPTSHPASWQRVNTKIQTL